MWLLILTEWESCENLKVKRLGETEKVSWVLVRKDGNL